MIVDGDNATEEGPALVRAIHGAAHGDTPSSATSYGAAD